jgi:hypothetical protein
MPCVASVGVLGGLVAAEGSFSVVRIGKNFADGSPRYRFVFAVKMIQADRPLLEALHSFLGTGNLLDERARKHWQPMSSFSITSLKRHHRATIQFAEAFLPPSQKRRQFDAWRMSMAEYERIHDIRQGRSQCRVDGCIDFVRGQGLCRRHYYRATGY